MPEIKTDKSTKTYQVAMDVDAELKKRILRYCADHYPLNGNRFLQQIVAEFFKRQDANEHRHKKKPEEDALSEPAA